MDISRDNFNETNQELGLLSQGANASIYVAFKDTVIESTASKSSSNPDTSSPSLSTPNNQPVAVKFYHEENYDSDGDVIDLESEIAVLKMLDGKHPNVIPLLDSYIDGEIQWFTMPFLPGGDLKRFKDYSRRRSSGISLTAMTRAMLYLYFGIPSDTPIEDMSDGELPDRQLAKSLRKYQGGSQPRGV